MRKQLRISISAESVPLVARLAFQCLLGLGNLLLVLTRFFLLEISELVDNHDGFDLLTEGLSE